MKNDSVVKSVFYALAVSTLFSTSVDGFWEGDKWKIPISLFIFYSSYLLDEVRGHVKNPVYEFLEYFAWFMFVFRGFVNADEGGGLWCVLGGLLIVSGGLFYVICQKKLLWSRLTFWLIENAVLIVIMGLLAAEVEIPLWGTSWLLWTTCIIALVKIICHIHYTCFGPSPVAIIPKDRIAEVAMNAFKHEVENVVREAAEKVSDEICDIKFVVK